MYRDYVQTWQSQLTHTNDFPLRVRQAVQAVISALSHKVRAVDWIPFLTTSLVDDIASHVRLFKKAKFLLLKAKKEISAASERDNGKFTSSSVPELEALFFDAEVAMENALVCRDLVCTIHQEEIEFLQSISELLLCLLLPKEDFRSLPLRTLVREILVNTVLKPVLDMVSDPDFINQSLVWLYQDTVSLKPELFMLVLRTSENLSELNATRESVNKDIAKLRSYDAKGRLHPNQKSELSALLSLRRHIDGRIHRVQGGGGGSGSRRSSASLAVDALSQLDDPAATQVDWNQMIGPGLKLFVLPLDVILKNNCALSYFIDYMTSVGCQAYIFFYRNIEGWRVSAEQQLLALDHEGESSSLDKTLTTTSEARRSVTMENMREAAHSIYEEYLSDKASPKLRLEDTAVKRLLFKIRTEPPDAEWFDEVQAAVFDKLRTDERFLESFKRSMGYVKLLAELDLLKADQASSSKSEEDDEGLTMGSGNTGEEASIYDRLSLNSFEGSRGSLDEVDASVVGDSGSTDSSQKSHKRHQRYAFVNLPLCSYY